MIVEGYDQRAQSSMIGGGGRCTTIFCCVTLLGGVTEAERRSVAVAGEPRWSGDERSEAR